MWLVSPGLAKQRACQSINLAQLLLRSEAGRRSDGQARNIFTNIPLTFASSGKPHWQHINENQ